MEKEKTVELQLILHCAPVLKGLKAANTICLPEHQLKNVPSLLEPKNIHMKVLYRGNQGAVVLIYREKRLLMVVNQVKSCAYLLEQGYRPIHVTESIDRLQDRVESYYKGNMEFPHELGLFLEYPLEDIIEYRKQKGKKFIINGYWKVYGQAERARNIFHAYDEARIELLKHYLKTGEIKIED